MAKKRERGVRNRSRRITRARRCETAEEKFKVAPLVPSLDATAYQYFILNAGLRRRTSHRTGNILNSNQGYKKGRRWRLDFRERLKVPRLFISVVSLSLPSDEIIHTSSHPRRPLSLPRRGTICLARTTRRAESESVGNVQTE